MLEIPTGWGKPREERLQNFGEELQKIQSTIPFQISSRGWCYDLEGRNLINKGEFDRVQKIINECRKKGYLPIHFCLDDGSRKFHHVWYPTQESPKEYLKEFLDAVLKVDQLYDPDFWDGEEYYVQILVEKIDLVSLFDPICSEYHIPIATAKGWSDINQRARMMDRFRIMEESGHKPLLLYFGDHDPYGIKISKQLLKNLYDLQKGVGWNPENLVIDRFGLNYDFIVKHNLTWIDNLISGSKKPPDYNDPVVAEYIKEFGERKVEANAVVVIADVVRQLLRDTIAKYLGPNILRRFEKKRKKIVREFETIQRDLGVFDPVRKAIELLEE